MKSFTTSLSTILDKTEVTDMCLKSPGLRIGLCFGVGLIEAIFHAKGTLPE